jgi:hypothetical protein
MNTHSSLRTIAGLLVILSWLLIGGGVLFTAFLLLNEERNPLSFIWVIFSGLPLMAFGKLIDLFLDIATDVNKIANKEKSES